MRGDECIWVLKEFPTRTNEVMSTRNHERIRHNTSEKESDCKSLPEPINVCDATEIGQAESSSLSPIFRAILKTPEDIHTDNISGDGELPASSLMKYNDFLQSNEFDFDVPNFLLTPSSTFSIYLDEAGLRLLDFFENKVAKLLCISPESSNYFLKTFFTVATSEESIMHALAAWGGVFSEGPSSDLVKYHMAKATTLIHEKHLNNPSMDKYGYYVAFCYFLIAIGVEICSGDVSNWYYHFNKCTELLKSYGGLAKFCRDFDYSNDVKWLIANFLFHDIMSSVTLSHGTSCSMNDYNSLFKNNRLLDIGDYGLDPYQGCIQPIYLILGEIMNAYVELKEIRKTLKKRTTEIAVQDPDLIELKELTSERMKHYQYVDKRYNELLDRVTQACPNQIQMSLIINNKEELNLHLTLFELYRQTCRMYLLLYIKQTQPSSSEVQILLLVSLSFIESLIESRMTASLPMLLLICGISCCNESDRIQIRDKFQRIYKKYKAGNVRRVWDIVEESWIRNPDGNLCIDWVGICEEFGWKLSVC